METEDERILRQRSRALMLANTGQRVGYGLLGVSLLLFFAGLVFGLTNLITTLISVCMALAALVLGPSIILGYAAKAAERYEKTGKTGH
jgi:hypothetical protein